MKTYLYYQLTATGPGRITKRGSLAELLKSIPYLLANNRLPPLRVLNDIFESGGVDAGMSGGSQWNPFTINQAEYSNLVEQCQVLGLEIANPPAWVRNRSDFHIWEFERDHGVPADKHKVLSDIERTAQARLNAAMKTGASRDEINRLHLEAWQAGNAVCEFVNDYLNTED